jgi:aspartate aminotransferase
MSNPNEFKPARRLDGVSESATLKLNATAQAMRAKGLDVINLAAGEPDFNVPQAAKQAVLDAVAANKSKYTPVSGIAELRDLVADKTNRQQPSVAKLSPWKAADVIVTNGGKQALFNAFMSMIDPGDEVLIPSPYWLSYPEMVKLAGGIPRFIHAPFSQGFKILPDQLRAAITPKVKALVLNSPSNPTGAMYSRPEFEALGKVLQASEAEKIWVLSDEIYDRINFGRIPFCSFLEAAPHLRERTVTLNGLSKSASMTGWRVGWSVAPQSITQPMNTLQGQSTSGINALAQWASIAALKVPEAEFAGQIESFKRRRDLTLENLGKASKLELMSPDGAFYAFVGLKHYLRQGEDSMGFAQRFLEEGKVAVVPGTPFGEPGFIRISFATDEKSLQEGCTRLVEYLK